MTPTETNLLTLLRQRPRLSDRRICEALGLTLGEVLTLTHGLRQALNLPAGASLRMVSP